MSDRVNMVVILGPTASGKTAVAANLAYLLQGEIISADSRQVYRELTIGSGKDYADYIIQDVPVPVHLIDIVAAGSQYNVFEFQKDFEKVFYDLQLRKAFPILCGGSGLYIEAVIQGYKLIQVPVNPLLRDELEARTLEELSAILSGLKKLHASTDTDNRKRTIRAIEIEKYYQIHPEIDHSFPKIRPLLFGIRYDRETRRVRITERLKQRLDQGLIEEVKTLLKDGLTAEELIYYGLEYKFVTKFVTGELTYEAMFTGLNTAIHQFAKRQMTWFRRMESQGMHIHWIDGHLPLEDKVDFIMQKLSETNNSAQF